MLQFGMAWHTFGWFYLKYKGSAIQVFLSRRVKSIASAGESAQAGCQAHAGPRLLAPSLSSVTAKDARSRGGTTLSRTCHCHSNSIVLVREGFRNRKGLSAAGGASSQGLRLRGNRRVCGPGLGLGFGPHWGRNLNPRPPGQACLGFKFVLRPGPAWTRTLQPVVPSQVQLEGCGSTGNPAAGALRKEHRHHSPQTREVYWKLGIVPKFEARATLNQTFGQLNSHVTIRRCATRLETTVPAYLATSYQC
eukprot:2552680-Rhodomonas_salina.1